MELEGRLSDSLLLCSCLLPDTIEAKVSGQPSVLLRMWWGTRWLDSTAPEFRNFIFKGHSLFHPSTSLQWLPSSRGMVIVHFRISFKSKLERFRIEQPRDYLLLCYPEMEAYAPWEKQKGASSWRPGAIYLLLNHEPSRSACLAICTVLNSWPIMSADPI